MQEEADEEERQRKQREEDSSLGQIISLKHPSCDAIHPGPKKISLADKKRKMPRIITSHDVL